MDLIIKMEFLTANGNNIKILDINDHFKLYFKIAIVGVCPLFTLIKYSN